jgi:DNA modification methylase
MKGGHGVYLHKDLSMNAIAKHRVHPAQKPVGLLRWCIEKLKLKPGDTILDPYMGSGSTGVAALAMGCHFIGVEIDPTHFATAEKRIHEAAAATPLFAC